MKRRTVSIDGRIFSIELTADELIWLKNVVNEKLEFCARLSHINYSERVPLGKSVINKLKESEFPTNLMFK